MKILNKVSCLTLISALLFTVSSTHIFADSAAELDKDAEAALDRLYAEEPQALQLAGEAKGILIFPDVLKAGLLVGGQFGEGALRQGGKSVGYYNVVQASYGLQAGVQTFGYAMFFMSDETLAYLDNSDGWEVGVGPSIVAVDKGAAASITTTSAKEEIYVFFFDQEGLMAGMGLQGTKITKINPE